MTEQTDGQSDKSVLHTGPIVLVVEDEILIRLALADELRDQGCLVLEAANADEALTILRSYAQIRVLISDIGMPGSMDGSELARFVRKTYPAIKIILASAHAGPDLLQVADGIHKKPYHWPDLIQTVLRLGGQEPRREDDVRSA